MSTVAQETRYTPEDLLKMPDGDRYELVDGQLVESSMSLQANYVTGLILALLFDFVRSIRSGWVFTEGASYQCFAISPTMVRKPDISYVRFGRFPNEQLPEGHCKLAPDLAVEVLSPNDVAYEVDHKVTEYLEAGVRLVWVVNPDDRNVKVYRPDSPGVILRENDELTGEDVLPGFRCRVGDFFIAPTNGATVAH